jgi:hypothetical protein
LAIKCVHKHLWYIFIVWRSLTQRHYLIDVPAFNRQILRWF